VDVPAKINCFTVARVYNAASDRNIDIYHVSALALCRVTSPVNATTIARRIKCLRIEVTPFKPLKLERRVTFAQAL
jgi:hypothetical protein